MTTTEKITGALYILCWCLVLYGISLDARAEEYGPYRADVVRVIDGDTVVLDAHIWPGMTQRTHLRLSGIDTPLPHSQPRGWRRTPPSASARSASANSPGA